VDQGGSVPLVHVATCSIWLASLPSSPLPASGRHSHDRWGGETCELNVTQWLMARRGSAVVQGHMSGHPWVIWLKWRRYEWSLVICSLLPQPTVLAGPSDQGHCPNDFLTAAYDHIRSSPFLANILTSWVLIWGCVLYIGLQIFTLWQKSKAGVRIIFDGVLYSKFYSMFACISACISTVSSHCPLAI